MRPVVALLAALLLLGAAAPAAADALTLTWTDNATNETSQPIERCAGVACTNFTALASAATNATTYVDSTVVAGTTYCYRVRAVNATDSSPYSNTACARVPAPLTAPTNLIVQ